MVECPEADYDDEEVISVGSDCDQNLAEKDLSAEYNVNFADAPCKQETLHAPIVEQAPRHEQPVKKAEIPSVDELLLEEERARVEDAAYAELRSEKAPHCPFSSEVRASASKWLRSRQSGESITEAEALLTLAELKLASGMDATAFIFARDAFRLFRDPVSVARALHSMVKSQIALDRPQEALKLLTDYMEKHGRSGKAKAILCQALSEAHLALGRPREALRDAMQAAESFAAAVRPGGGAQRDAQLGQVSALKQQAAAQFKLGPAGSRQALATQERALSLARDFKDSKVEADALVEISRLHLARHEHEDAYAFSQAAVELAHSIDDKKSAANALREMATVLHAVQEDPDMVIQVAQESLDLAQHLSDWPGEVASHLVLAKAHLSDAMLNFAIDSLKTALALARKVDNCRQIQQVLQAMVDALPADRGLQLMEDEVQLARNVRDLRREGLALLKVSSIQLSLGRREQALLSAEEGVRAMREARDPRGEAAALRNVADFFIMEHRYAEATEMLVPAKQLLQEHGDIRGAVDVLQVLRPVHALMKRGKDMLKTYTEERAIFKAAAWKDEEAEAMLTLAKATMHNSKDALKTANDAMAMYKELKDRTGEARAMLVVAELQMSVGASSLKTIRAARLAEALRTMKGAQEIFKSLGDTHGEAETLQAMAKLHIEQQSNDEAVAAAKAALQVCRRAGDCRGEADALGSLSEVLIAIVKADVKDGMKPDPAALQEALATTSESSAAFGMLGDQSAQSSAQAHLSSLQLLARNGRGALKSARRSLESAAKGSLAHLVTSGLVALANAYVYLGGKQQAQMAADDAKDIMKEFGDDDGLVEVEKVLGHIAKMEDDDVTVVEMPSDDEEELCSQDRLAPESWQAVQEACDAAEHRRLRLLNQEQPLPPTEPDQQRRRKQLLEAAQAIREARAAQAATAPDTEKKSVGGGQHASQAASKPSTVKSKKKSLALPAPDQKLDRSQPDSSTQSTDPPVAPHITSAPASIEARTDADAELGERQKMSMEQDHARQDGAQAEVASADGPAASSSASSAQPQPSNEDSKATQDASAAAKVPSLALVLQEVRPDWVRKDIAAVMQKLSQIGVRTASDLFAQLKDEESGAPSVNAKLKAAGQKCLRTDTLEALRVYGNRVHV